MTEATPRYNRISEILNGSGRDNDLLIALEAFIDLYKEERVKKESLKVPLSMFSDRNLGILESCVKCLKENFGLNYSKIAALLNRDDRTIWTAYKKAIGKRKEKFSVAEEKYSVPCSIFSDRKLGPLESLAVYLKDEQHLSIKKISELLNRNYRTIWLSYHHGIGKRGVNEQEASTKEME